MLSRIKMDYPRIRRALLEIDDAALSVDALKALSKQLPTTEEVLVFFYLLLYLLYTILTRAQMERLKSFDDVNKLSKADQYFYEVCLYDHTIISFSSVVYKDYDNSSSIRASRLHAISTKA